LGEAGRSYSTFAEWIDQIGDKKFMVDGENNKGGRLQGLSWFGPAMKKDEV